MFVDWFQKEGITPIELKFMEFNNCSFVVVETEQDFKWLCKLHQVKTVYRREMEKYVKYCFFTTKGYCIQFNYSKQV